VLLLGSGHVIPSGEDERGGLDGVEVMTEQCRAQNRQLISEMRELTFVLCTLFHYFCGLCEITVQANYLVWYSLISFYKMVHSPFATGPCLPNSSQPK